MKKALFFAAAAICAAALAVSCENKELEVNVAPSNEMVTMICELPSPDSKVAIDIDGNVGKVRWEVGDKIHIHTGHIRDGEVALVELTANDISQDGKTATITFPTLKKYDYTGNGFGENYSDYYAAYPADALSNPSSCYNKQYFSNCNTILMAASDKDGVFLFHNLCGLITFSVTGDFDSYVFSGNKEEAIAYETYVAEIVEKNGTLDYKDSKTTGPKALISADLISGTNTICIPSGAEFTEGFSIKFKKNGEIVKEAKTTKAINVERNKILALGDITSKLGDYVPEQHVNQITGATNLGSSETANCYIVTAAGSYKIPAVKGNSNTSVGTVAGAKLIWETYCSDTAPEANSIIAAVDYEEDAVFFKTPETLVPGNALIAAVDANETILWSWHIWIPASAIENVGDYFVSSKYFMDRNLGALIATEASSSTVSAKSFGLLYQWGRKDPFVGAREYKSESKAKVAGSENGVDDSSSFTIESSYAAPNTFAKNNAWLTGQLEWNPEGNKSINDPCPAGYKVPDYSSDLLWGDVANADGFEGSTAYGWWKIGKFVFPLCGYSESGGGISHAYDRCRLFTNEMLADGYPEHAKAQYLYDNSGSWKHVGDTRKRYASSIRCVKIEGSVPEPEAPELKGASAVTLDGSFDDWASADAITTSNSRIKEWKFGYDASNLYFYYKIVKEKIVPEGEKDAYEWDNYIYVGLDTDNNAETGSRVGGGTAMETGGEAKILIYPWRGLVSESNLSIINGVDADGSIQLPVGTAVADAHPTVYGVFDGDYCYLEVGIPRSAIGDLASKIGVAHCMSYSDSGMSKVVIPIK